MLLFQKDCSGLARIAIFFKMILHEIKSNIIEIAQVVPIFLVGLCADKKSVQIIKNKPYSPSNVIYDIKMSKTGFLKIPDINATTISSTL